MHRKLTSLALAATILVGAAILSSPAQTVQPDGGNTGDVVTTAPPPALPEPPERIRVDRAPAPIERNLDLPPDPRGFNMTLAEAWVHGGLIMWLILALSILGGALSLYLFFLLRPSQIVPRSLLSELRDNLADGDLNSARRACERRSSPLASVTLAALDYIRNVPEADAHFLKDTVEAEGGRQAEDLQSQTQFLLDISVIAPMLGLLGTVLGMLRAFGAIAHDYSAAKPVILAAGVSQAIVTTIFGLAVAIPCMILYAHFRRRTVRMTAMLETAATELLALLTRRTNK